MGKAGKCVGDPDQKERCFGMAVEKGSTGRERDSRAMVTTHAINSKRDHGR